MSLISSKQNWYHANFRCHHNLLVSSSRWMWKVNFARPNALTVFDSSDTLLIAHMLLYLLTDLLIDTLWHYPPFAGTEYDVLPSLLQHGAICRLSGLFIEYHRNQVVHGKSSQSSTFLTHFYIPWFYHSHILFALCLTPPLKNRQTTRQISREFCFYCR